MVKLAVKRHIADIKASEAGNFPYIFDHKKAQTAILFFSQLVHTKGKLAGTKLKPEPWQQFIISNLYGWRRRDNGKRRFRRAYIQVARKNGKSFLAAGVSLYDLMTEPGAEVYSAATKKDQARIVFDDAKKTVQYSPDLKKYIKPLAHSLTCRDGSMKPLASDSNTLDGLNPSCAIIDEYHAHKTTELLDVIDTGMRARQQPLMFIITTAGNNRNAPCFEEYEKCKKMLSGASGYENDEYFSIIYELDKGDDWKNEKNWYKANPNLGVSVEMDTMRSAYKEATLAASAETAFRTKNLNEWLNVAEVWINEKRWANCLKRFNEKNLEKIRCWGGIDLSKRLDFTVLTWYFALPNGKRYAKHHFYIPEGQIDIKMRQDSYRIRQWIKQGYIKATPGDTQDFNYMLNDIREDAKLYDIQDIAYDRNLAEYLIQDLSSEFDCVEFSQSIIGMSEPSKAWEQAITEGKIIDNNPVMAWMVSCTTVKPDANGNIKPIKPDTNKTSKRIDGVITSIMANNRLEVTLADEVKSNVAVEDMFF
ncbi:MAG: hypothetical protein K5640_07015 [Treponema sp.]|nr:hypothetical protein [Treponema sp.]